LAELRAHFKTERYVYNTKRKQAGLKPISQEAWERKLRESREGYEKKGTAHLKAKKPARKGSGENSELPVAPERAENVPGAFGREGPPPDDEAPLTPRTCLFDRKHFDTVELCLAYMEKTHSFFIPDQEYCKDVPVFMNYLAQKVSIDHACINCNRRFPDLQSVRRHMVDKGHTQLASEARTRRGNFDEGATEDLKEELEPFYDYNSSVREVAEKIHLPQQKVASILRFFDADKDKKLGPDEVANLWGNTNDGATMTQAQYEGACAMCGAEPKDGIDVDQLAKLYADGFANLDDHFAILQDLLVAKHRKLQPVQEADEDDEDGEESEEEDGDSDCEGNDELEIDDEDEFEEVMRVLGLHKVEITETGDLKLPNGNVAAHRDVSYIYRQRGVRQDQVALHGGSAKFQKRAQLMLSNSGTGCVKMAMTTRQTAREGKRIVAYLRHKNAEATRVGLQMNLVNKKNTAKIRTGRGDCSNGR
jgi:hypothetical protein